MTGVSEMEGEVAIEVMCVDMCQTATILCGGYSLAMYANTLA